MTAPEPSEREALKPCPFCGYQPSGLKFRTPENNGQYNAWAFSVECEVCQATGPYRIFNDGLMSRRLAVEAWNSRVDSPGTQWIACTERMPSESGEYLIFGGTYHDVAFFNAKNKFHWFDRELEEWIPRHPQPLFWQPLPPPPTQQKEKEKTT